MSAADARAFPRVVDVAVVGGGIAGMIAAVRAAELGLRVLVLEKGDDPLYPCNSRYTGGAFHVCFHDVTENAASLAGVIGDVTRGFAQPELAVAVGSQARDAVRWLKQQGVRFIKVGPDAWRQNFLAPPSLMKTGLNWQGRGGDVMLRALRDRLESQGGSILQGARARELVMHAGRCVGVRLERGSGMEEIRASAVVLCDGGFQANLSLMREFVSPAPEKLKQRGAATGQGDALLMAREVGAGLVGMRNVYGHLLCQDALANDALWPYPILDSISTASIVIDATGRRFTDEGLGGVSMTNDVARLQDPLSSTVVFDQAIWDGPATEFILPANPHLVLAGGRILVAPTVDELATQLRVPSDELHRTIDAYNRAVESGRTHDLTPPRTTTKARPFPLRKAPYYAVRLAAGVTYTMGGLAIDDRGRVQRDDGGTIPGLYASGCATGGLEGGPAAGYVGGLTKSSVMSLRVADALNDDLRDSTAPRLVRTVARQPVTPIRSREENR